MKDHIIREITSPSARFVFHKETQPDTLLFRCQGAFSLVNHAQLDALMDEVTRAQAGRIILDLSQVVHADSAGIGTLAMAVKHSLTAAKRLVLVPSDPVRVLLDTSQLSRAVPTVSSLEEAMVA
jgi:anti-anti-sigma factor